uniref:Uncharacterized protein n=1 Tax=Aegilops tauschii TaxID=37682 RepID=M8B2I9_AEGTA
MAMPPCHHRRCKYLSSHEELERCSRCLNSLVRRTRLDDPPQLEPKLKVEHKPAAGRARSVRQRSREGR